jgi:short-subunit dehydrogenase
MSTAQREVAVVTGATGGMGRVIALELAGLGMHVVTIARDARRADDLQARIDRTAAGALEVVPGDLATRDGIRAAAATIADRHEVVQVLINNAGAHFPSHQVTADGLELHIAVD